MSNKFEEWYEKNRNYFFVKHEGDEKKMEEDARQSHHAMILYSSKPAMQAKEKEVKKKPNPYGF